MNWKAKLAKRPGGIIEMSQSPQSQEKKPPRLLAEIDKEYTALAEQNGVNLYQKHLFELKINAILRRCFELNQEADERKALDEAQLASQIKEQPAVATEQSQSTQPTEITPDQISPTPAEEKANDETCVLP